jgi:hypothetical protein
MVWEPFSEPFVRCSRSLSELTRPIIAAFTEEFHQTYALTPDGRVELDNINGDVHISTWDRSEVKVDAVKVCRLEGSAR